MSDFLKECFSAKGSVTKLLFASTLWLALQATATAQVQTQCSGNIPPNWPTPPVTLPNPPESQAINDLIARFSSALESKDPAILDDIFDENARFEVCTAGGNVQNFLATSRNQIVTYYNNLWPALSGQGLTTHHVTSNVLLNKADANTIEGKFTQLVLLQTSFSPQPQFDYTGNVRVAFVKDQNTWRFSSFLLISNIPDLGGDISVQAR